MAVLKVACPKCGQRVSGDDGFFGTTVECPVCSSVIRFPDRPAATPAPSSAPGSPPPPSQPAPPAEPSPSAPAATPQPAAGPERRPDPAPPAGADAPSPLLGVVSMVLGIVSVALLCLPGIVFGPAAIIAGHFALSKAKASRIRPVPGRGAAITGLILGYLSLLGFILITLLIGPWMVEKIRASAPPP